MRFQRCLKWPRPLPRGYYAMQTDRINTDQPTFQIGGNTDLPMTGNQSIQLPEFLKVKARINPIKHQGEDVPAVVERLGPTIKPYSIYQEHIDYQYQAIQLVFENFLSKIEILGPESPVLLEKAFVVQSQGSCVLKQDVVDRKLIITPPGKENGQPLWGYGGYYQVGCDLKQIEQIFFTPMIESSKTAVHLTKASSWVAKSVLPSAVHQKPEIKFMDEIKDEGMLNLVGEIEQGQASFSLPIGVDETGAVHKQTYQSVSIQQEDALTPFVEIIFKKGE
jgi:hypothetical protein